MQSNRLTDLAERVRAAEVAMQASARATAEHAVEAGRLLVEAKGECSHGEWLPFLERAGVAQRQAQRLMLLARSGLKSDTVSELGIKAALEMATQRRLPEGDDVLVVSIGEPVAGGQRFITGETTVLVWRSPSQTGYCHVASWRERADGGATAEATDRPIAAERPEVIFGLVDQLLEHDYGAMRFSRWPQLIPVAEEIRRSAMPGPTH